MAQNLQKWLFFGWMDGTVCKSRNSCPSLSHSWSTMNVCEGEIVGHCARRLNIVCLGPLPPRTPLFY